MVRVRVLSASRDVVVFRQLTVEHIRNDELSKRKKQQFLCGWKVHRADIKVFALFVVDCVSVSASFATGTDESSFRAMVAYLLLVVAKSCLPQNTGAVSFVLLFPELHYTKNFDSLLKLSRIT